MTESREKRRPSRVLGTWVVDVVVAAIITWLAWQWAWSTSVERPLDLAISAVTFVAVLLLLRALRS